MKASRSGYTKTFARAACLPRIEIWSKGESTDPRQWTSEQQPYQPYLIFEHTPETVYCFMDPAGWQWADERHLRLYQEKRSFCDRVIRMYYEKFGPWKSVWEKERVLTHTELVRFLHDLRDGWPWFEALWGLMEVLDPASADFRKLESVRSDTDRFGSGTDMVIRKSLQQIFPELGELSSVLQVTEIIHRQPPTHTELERRMQHYFYADATLFVCATRQDMEERFGVIIEQDTAAAEEVTGQSAFPGLVRGRVMNRTQMGNLRTGDVLVTPMTTLDLLPAAHKAAAIVTDEGGVTSHAAILAREIKKPCIIGTKIATQVFKNGDLVEVDAEKGIARKQA